MDFRDAALSRLTNPQRAAWRCVEETILDRQADARVRVTSLLRSSGCSQAMFDAATESLRHHARVVLHFHPDRLGVRPVPVCEALCEEGQYRSQFETGLSSGGLTAFPGGARDEWERTLFGGAYHGSGSSIGDRPKYGALELIRYPDGPWPRFGSCYFVLRSGCRPTDVVYVLGQRAARRVRTFGYSRQDGMRTGSSAGRSGER
jgi:hypothetical protein